MSDIADQMTARTADTTVQDDIDNDYKVAFKAKEQEKYLALRPVLSKIKQTTIDERRELTNEEILKLLRTEVKSRKEAREQFKQGNRDDLVKQADYEIELIESYLPAQMTDADLEALVKGVLEEVGATSPADMGKAMGAVMAKVGTQADGGRVKAMVMKLLA